ncbi:MAG TPA: NfeD family protein [Candidatus Caccousia avistercoris]|nr:NfeD family protein [Candidatus Caccousia avistercoris]
MEIGWALFWLAIIVAAVVVEASTNQLVSIWFVVGGIAALIANLCGAQLWLQWVLFVVVSALALLCTRPLVKRLTTFRKQDTNAGRCIGQIAVVTETVDNIASQGQAKVLGSVWTARSARGTVLPAGSKVVVRAIEGVKLIVEEIQPPAAS